MERLVAQCRESGVRVRQEAREQLTLLAKTPAHQGVVALVRPQEFLAIEDLYTPAPATAGAARLLLALDGVEDPQNLGTLPAPCWPPSRFAAARRRRAAVPRASPAPPRRRY